MSSAGACVAAGLAAVGAIILSIDGWGIGAGVGLGEPELPQPHTVSIAKTDARAANDERRAKRLIESFCNVIHLSFRTMNFI